MSNAQRLQLLPLELIGLALIRKKALYARVNSFCPSFRPAQRSHASVLKGYQLSPNPPPGEVDIDDICAIIPTLTISGGHHYPEFRETLRMQ